MGKMGFIVLLVFLLGATGAAFGMGAAGVGADNPKRSTPVSVRQGSLGAVGVGYMFFGPRPVYSSSSSSSSSGWTSGRSHSSGGFSFGK